MKGNASTAAMIVSRDVGIAEFYKQLAIVRGDPLNAAQPRLKPLLPAMYNA